MDRDDKKRDNKIRGNFYLFVETIKNDIRASLRQQKGYLYTLRQRKILSFIYHIEVYHRPEIEDDLSSNKFPWIRSGRAVI